MKEQAPEFQEFDNSYKRGCYYYERGNMQQAIKFFEEARIFIIDLASLNDDGRYYILDMYRKMLHIYFIMLDYDNCIKLGEDLINLQEIENDDLYNCALCKWMIANAYMYKSQQSDDQNMVTIAKELFKLITQIESNNELDDIYKEVHTDMMILDGIERGLVKSYICFNLSEVMPISCKRPFKIIHDGMPYSLTFYQNKDLEASNQLRQTGNNRCYCSSVYIEMKYFMSPCAEVKMDLQRHGVGIFNQFLKLYRFNSGNYEVKDLVYKDIEEMEFGLNMGSKKIRFGPWSDKVLGILEAQPKYLFTLDKKKEVTKEETSGNSDSLYFKLLTSSKNALFVRDYTQAILDANVALENFIYGHFYDRLMHVRTKEQLDAFLKGNCPCEECEFYLSSGKGTEDLSLSMIPNMYQMIKYMNRWVPFEISNRQLVKLLRKIIVKRNEIVRGDIKEIKRKDALQAVYSLEKIIDISLKTSENKMN